MTLMEEKTLADHDINVRSIRQELRLLEEQLKKHEVTDIHTGYVGVDDDYPVSVKQVLNITAELGALETQNRVRELPRYQVTADPDTVSRQAAIEAVEFGITHAKAINKETGEVVELFRASNNELRKAVDRIKQLPPSPSRPQWIPCTERLPEKPENYPNCEIRRTYYIVSLESGCVKALAYEFDRDEWQHTGSPVTAWMPLPEPYHNS